MPLLLKSLELHGYKTFASRTLFEFAEGITAIVGPNGSGKSNIADSLRWVLGEQSYSLLRAKKTEDMIFAGSEGRPRAGMASATVIFDNAGGWLPVDFSEVALTRRAYRDGRNEYLLNGQQVRLREINELLAQSGLSERTYTILGQGLVDASLALKADERRRLFEEAAGVGLYRARREETLRRLDTTSRNLERVLDIIAELEPRLRSLERQARRALEYAHMQNDLRVLLREWYGYHWHRAQKELAGSRENLRLQDSQLQDARLVFQNSQQEVAVFRENLQGLRARLNAWHRASSDLHARRESASRELAVLEERRRSLLESRQSLTAEQGRLADESELAQEKLVQTVQEVERLEAEHAESRTQLSSVQETLQARQAERAAVEGKLQTARQLVSSLHARRAEQKARLDEYASRLENLQKRLAETGQAIQTASQSASQAGARHRASVSAREQVEHDLQAAETALHARQEQNSALETARRQKQEERSGRHAGQTRLSAQLDVLQQAEQTLTGYGEGARFLLDAARQSRLRSPRGTLSAALDVPVEYETAVAAALGDHLDALLLESGQDAEQALQLLEQGPVGRAALLPLEWLAGLPALRPPRDPGCLGLASALVRAPDALRPVVELLLGQVLVASDRSAARRLVQGQPAHVRVVTLRGEVFRPDGLVLAGKAAPSGTLSRPRQKRELQGALAEADAALLALDRELEALSARLESARREEAALEASQRDLRKLLDEKRSAERQASLDFESARRQHEWQQAQQSQFQNELARIEKERQQVQASQAEAELKLTASMEEVRQLTAGLAGLVLDEIQAQVSYWGTRLAVAARALEDARSRQSERSGAAGRLQEQGQVLQRRLQEAGQSLVQLDEHKDALRQRENDLNEQISALQLEIGPAERELETAEAREVQLQEQESTAQRSLAVAERAAAQAQMELTRRQEALASLRQRIEDDFGLVAFAYETSIDGPVPLPLDGMVEQLQVVTELSPNLEEHLTQQRAQLRRMGPINPEAKQEYDSEHDRYEFMTSQVADLRKAEADLHEVIAELDELTKQEFQKTFQAVDKEFREIFVRLFGGGSARLSLTDPENLVETGIEIEARLPGRREQGLALLSGGERSLTAIALVFALLKVSPTPVCVMDEVDAMLDEANVGRFRDLLAELSRDTQFIIVTHNRNTVQAADVIYGITMGRDSASQMISLRLDEVSDEFLGARG